MMAKTFSAQIDDIVKLTDAKITAVVRQSVQEVIDIAQTPLAKGGKMRVDTGFLRASGQMSLSGMPSGPTRPDNDAKPGQYSYNAATVLLNLGKFKVGQTIYFGWTANYAKYREVYDGFLASAVKNWPAIVEKNVRKVSK